MTSLTVSSPPALARRADVYVLIDRWLAHLDLQVQAGELSPATRNTYQRGLDKFLDWAEGKQVVTDDLILEWKASLKAKGHKPNTINTWLSAARAFFTWAVNARLLTHNPAANIRGAKRTGSSRHHLRDRLTDDEVLRVLAQPDPSTNLGKRDRAILYLMAYTAVRTIEVHRANLEDLHTAENRLVLRVHGKGRDDADEPAVLTNPALQTALYDWLAVRGADPGPLFTSLSPRTRGDRLSLRAIRQIVKAYYLAAGVVAPNKTTHSLRHAAISNAARRAPLQKVQSMARHANLSTTMIYVHESDRLANPAEADIDYTPQS